MKSPFKFLDPYGPEDFKAFFGRERETQELYDLVTKNRLTFVYGPSGTGKTSLVRCGLANRFKGFDWLPLFIRRGEDINTSLRETIGHALKREVPDAEALPDAIDSLFNRYLRPVYLIFDQFEELFILGDRNPDIERIPFYNTIADLLDMELACNILFIMREDYFGHLDQFERLVPELYHRKLRVEPMSRENLRNVLVGSCAVYNISFGDRDHDPDLMLENILTDRSAVQMPFVQVYLHKLYDKAVYLQGITEDTLPRLRFNQEVIDHLGPLENALGHFLEDQEEEILAELTALKPGADIVRRVLDVFVSEEGTKVPISYLLDEEGGYILEGKAQEVLFSLDPQLVDAVLKALEKGRIIRQQDDRLEVAHDTLAALIDQQRSNEQRQLNEVRRRIEFGYQEHRDSGGTYFFDRGQLSRVEPFLEKINLKDEWQAFITGSQQHVEAEENQERIRAEKELALTQQKLEAEQAAQAAKQKQLDEARLAATRQRRFLILTSIVAILAMVATVFAVLANQEVEQRNLEILARSYENNIVNAKSFRNTRNFVPAIAQLDSAQSNAIEIGKSEELANYKTQWAAIFKLIETSDSLNAKGEKYQAKETLAEAFQMDTGFELIENELITLQAEIDQDYADLMSRAAGQEAILGRGHPATCALYEEAAKLKPNETALNNKLKDCK